MWSSPLQPGYRLDRYELLWPIAHGGTASVWAARLQGKHGFEKLVAVKTILPQLAGDARLEQMFLDEARLVAQIRHPNVAEILDLGEQDEVLYLVFEWIDGESLTTLRKAVAKRQANIPVGIALRIMIDVCAGLHAAHELRSPKGELLHVVHRDVSPQNILISTAGAVKVIDFGIAKALNRLAGNTSVNVLKGKVQYMAPEQAQHQPADRRADLWSAGVVLYELVSGRLPYEGENPIATLHMLLSRMPPVPPPQHVPQPVVDVIRRALRHAPEQRFQTAAQMQLALESAMRQCSEQISISDLATFCEAHLAPHSARRRQAINAAYSTLADRAQSAPESSAPSVPGPDSPAAFLPAPRALGPSSAPRPIAALEAHIPTTPPLSLPEAASSSSSGLTSWPASLSESSSEVSLRPLGSTAVELRLSPPVRSRRWLGWAIGGALLASVLAAVGTSVLLGQTKPQTPPEAAALPSASALPPVSSPASSAPVIDASSLPTVPPPPASAPSSAAPDSNTAAAEHPKASEKAAPKREKPADDPLDEPPSTDVSPARKDPLDVFGNRK